MTDFLIGLVSTNEGSIIKLISINERNTINVVFNSRGGAIERVDSDNGKVDKVEIIDTSNSRGVKINF